MGTALHRCFAVLPACSWAGACMLRAIHLRGATPQAPQPNFAQQPGVMPQQVEPCNRKLHTDMLDVCSSISVRYQSFTVSVAIEHVTWLTLCALMHA